HVVVRPGHYCPGGYRHSRAVGTARQQRQHFLARGAGSAALSWCGRRYLLALLRRLWQSSRNSAQRASNWHAARSATTREAGRGYCWRQTKVECNSRRAARPSRQRAYHGSLHRPTPASASTGYVDAPGWYISLLVRARIALHYTFFPVPSTESDTPSGSICL